MKLKISSIQTLILIAIFIFAISSSSAFAQFTIDDIAFGDDVNDETAAAPIDMLVYLGVFIGGLLGVKKLKK